MLMKYLTRLCLLFLCVLPCLSGAPATSGIRVITEDAIPYARFLSKADFDRRFPGVEQSGPSELDTGWYVIYEHESLSYYFGPMLLESTGQDYLAQLEKTLGAVVDQRPSITGYRLELSYEPSVASEPASSESEESSVSGAGSPPPPPPPPSIFSLIRRFFGF